MGQNPEQVVLMEGISSIEHFLFPGKTPRRVLDDISLLIRKGEVWGISGTLLFEIKLLLEIIANIRPYDKGKCVLIERGMMRRKRVILNHVFYIGSSDMLYKNMNVLEFLMFATAKFKINKVLLQEEIFEFIIAIGLGHISLTSNYKLTKEEKALIILIVAAYSESLIIVFNLPEYQWDEVLINAMAKIADFIREREKTLIMGTQNCLLIEKACTHTAILGNGSLIYSGTVNNFRRLYDKVEIIIQDSNVLDIKEKLAQGLPNYNYVLKGNILKIRKAGREESDPRTVYTKILESGITPDSIEINPKTVLNAYEELLREHDL
ncbi:hypothetical protein Desor_2097 [Desulfosporosinus orientis DSM 765]|uniref:ABC transporter domain-containing protein n=1 Tax=Desulfosporosinus orientis (strain ATCC 19365 / DSM 765 / NCIMB 8382 / VKM B-1628 / Singapore I) TaxID=768706 RepID=G7W643_DESOD|nr:multidrug ABC transporter ATPase [Desulfosporosinus orientis]AET67705.1 hypothetical protein Desor_2097 [Desulfosporosinus orientis DSM 765]